MSFIASSKELKEDIVSSAKSKKPISSLGLLRNKSIIVSLAKNKENIKLNSPKQSCKS